jgi:hypothetical protein
VSAQRLEAFLARIYTDPALEARFVADPEGEARRAGLDVEEAAALAGIDRVGLELACRSFARKRAARRPRPGWLARATSWLRR